MSAFEPKNYQRAVLESVEKYFRACHRIGNADTAFYETTRDLWDEGIPYRPIEGLPPAMPYFCLRVPTGGGKTWLAAKSVALVNTHLLRCQHSVILWMVPSNAIREQTLSALKKLDHPYHAALREAGPVTVLDLDEAKSVTPATLETSTTIIVCTRQAFQVDNQDIRKVYESSGALMPHFQNLTAEQKSRLDTDADDNVPYSLLNALRLRRPFVVVDEAHNSRTELAFDTLARFAPSGIMELTATPDTRRTPSNVLHSVSAAELKAEEMIKLPILLRAEGEWEKCLHYALDQREQLQAAAEAERRAGQAYLRPIVLIQAERRSREHETLDVGHVREALIERFHVPPEEIVIATGEHRGLEKLEEEFESGIADERCPVKFVITQQALAEGWDCPFAYILVSMAELSSATAVEQLLGRILRQPQARHRQTAALNQSYAFVVSKSFNETARALRDRLVEGAGFERREAGEFVSAGDPAQEVLDLDKAVERVDFQQFSVALDEKPNARKLAKFKDKVSWDKKEERLVVTAPLSELDAEEVAAAVKSETARSVIQQAAKESRKRAAESFFHTPAESGESLRIPQLALRIQGELELFDDPSMLALDWEPSPYDAAPTADEIEVLEAKQVAEGGVIDVSESGRMTTEFIANLQRDLGLSYVPEHWDQVRLATWLCRNLPEPTITHVSKRAFVSHWLDELLHRTNMDLARLNRQKFLLRDLLENRIRALRQAALDSAYQEALFGEQPSSDVAVSQDYAFEFPPHGYAPGRYDGGEYGHYRFKKHFYGQIGAFDSQEEFDCACWLDQQAEGGRILFWVRNPVRRESCSFFLQKADGRFYPDFISKLPNGNILVVEYKGADRWDTPKVQKDRVIGQLWASLSEGRCRFAMVKDRDWSVIEAQLG